VPELLVNDTGGSPANGAAQAEKLVMKEGVKVLFGCTYTPAAVPMLAVTQRKRRRALPESAAEQLTSGCDGLPRKVMLDCVTATPGLFTAPMRCRASGRVWRSTCAVFARPLDSLHCSSAWRALRSALSWRATAWARRPRSGRPFNPVATSAVTPASCSTWTSRNFGRFRKSGHRVTGIRTACRTAQAGWEFVHIAIDDFFRIAYAEVLPDEKGRTCARFMRRTCKAERFIQSMLREWAYVPTYGPGTCPAGCATTIRKDLTPALAISLHSADGRRFVNHARRNHN
jgi:hypothetical protein